MQRNNIATSPQKTHINNRLSLKYITKYINKRKEGNTHLRRWMISKSLMHQIGGEREGGREGEDLIVTILRAVKEEGSITRGEDRKT